MNTTISINPARLSWLKRGVFPVLLTVLALAFNTPPALAQSSVEKAETSQQVQERVDELQRATNAVIKGEKQEKPKTGMLVGDYSVTSSMEFGIRTSAVRGSREKYLSDVNIRDGWRLFDYTLDSRSVSGAGLLYDFMHADATGAGGDPQQTYNFRIDKARAYKFDASVRRLYYFRYLPTFAANFHNMDTRQQISDFNLKLLPQRKMRVNLGYNRALTTGFGQGTISAERDVFPNPGQRRWESNNYRAGVDITHGGWDFLAEQSYRTFKWDTTQTWPGGTNSGFFPTDNATLTLFSRVEPSRSHAAVTRASLRGSLAKRVHLVTRGIYSEERMDGFFREEYQGTATSPANTRVLTNVYQSNGYAKRPGRVFDAALSFDLTEHLTLNNTYRYSKHRILGDAFVNTFRQQQTGTGPIVTTNPSPFSPNQVTGGGFFGTRNLDLASHWNTVDLQYSPSRKFTANLGWRATHRAVEVRELVALEEDTLNTHTVIGNLRVRPVDALNLFFDYERGEADNVFVRIGALDFQRVRARANVTATDKLSFSATFAATDRTNPTPQVQNESDYRTVSVSALWEPHKMFLLNAGYNYDDLAATANIYYFIASQARTGKSLFYAKQDFFFADARVGITKYVDLLLVYRYLRDKGAPSSPPVTNANDIVTAFPLKRHNPEARLAVHLSRHATLNVSWRNFSYNERNFAVQDYHSNILTSSLRFTF